MSYFFTCTLRCNHPGCVSTFTSSASTAMKARAEARSVGWIYAIKLRHDAGPAPTKDLCSVHCGELDDFKIVA